MVLSKSSKDKNKTAMVLKFANGIKTTSNTQKNPVGSRKPRDISPMSKGKSERVRKDKTVSNGHLQSTKDRGSDHVEGVPSPSNRTRLSITHATSGLNSVDDEPKSRDFTCYREQILKRKNGLNGDTRRWSVTGAKGQMEFTEVVHAAKHNSKMASHKRSSDGNMALNVRPRDSPSKEHAEIKEASFGDANKCRMELKFTSGEDIRRNTRKHVSNTPKNTEGTCAGDSEDIVGIIKEIEAIPLVSLEQDNGVVVGNGVCNGTTRRLSKLTSNMSSSTDSQDNGNVSQSTSPYLSRLSTESRISNETPSSLLSNNSRSSRKSLAETIMERHADHHMSRSPSCSVLECHSVDIPTGPRSSISGDTNCSINLPTCDSDCSTVECTSISKTKHSPDLVATQGENARPIMRRRRIRKILTAE